MEARQRAGKRRGWSIAAAVLLSGVLAACGGGTSDDASPLPATLTVSAPSGATFLGTAVAFSTNASGDFTYQWAFGDGETSTEAAPSHLFARAGLYAVTVTLRNDDGQTATATISVAVADRAIVQGKVCSGPAESGWCWQQPLPQGNPIRAYHFVDDSVVYAVGQRGQILKSTDGGATWRGQAAGTTSDLGAISFAGAQVGWVAGSFGEVLRTGDGGATWQRLSIGRPEPISAVGAVDASRAWAITVYGAVLVTRDGGRQWAQLALPEAAARTVALSDSEFWLLPYPAGSPPSALHTTDGGSSWVRVPLPALPAGFYADSSDLQFVDAARGLYVRTEYGPDSGGVWVYRRLAFLTVDGGATWQAVTPPNGADTSSRYLLAAPGTVYWSQPYLNPARSTDGGASWQTVTLPLALASSYDPQLRSLGGSRLIVSDWFSGETFVSVDGGATWDSRHAGGPGNGAPFNSVWFFDSREGVAWAENGSSARTLDGGQTWTVTTPAPSFGWRRGQFVGDGSLGWIVSDTGTIYRSTDRGRTWFASAPQTGTPMSGVQDVHFVDAMHGWAVSPYGTSTGSAIWTSNDGGLSWQLPAGDIPGGFVSVRFADATHGVAVGPPGVALVTADGGLTWTARPTGAYSLYRVTFADANTAVAVGEQGTIVRSTDRGESWTVVSGATFNALLDVRFVSATVGHAVGDQGMVLVTRDSGLSWSRQESGTSMFLRGVFFLDEMTGWAVGYGGAILATATGGR